MSFTQKHLQHLHLRAGFGLIPSELKNKLQQDRETSVEKIFKASKSIQPLEFLEDPTKGKEVGDLRILFMLLKSEGKTQDLNCAWIEKMTVTSAQLREKMTLFWHNHFATSAPFAWLMQVQNNTLRKNALGSFRELLFAVAHDPAMIIYLNNQQNKKDAPNENFAREVMELFTLGEGNIYTEHDIKEAARAFTGWTVNKRGVFEFEEEEHDSGEKIFLGRTGNFTGDDILNIILEEKQTAYFITTKIYKHFVNAKVNTAHIEILAEEFYASDYDITALMQSIFLSDWFYDDENIGCIIISPVELIIRYKKLTALTFRNEKEMLKLQRILGQVLFFPPNVAGWPGNTHWIDSTTLPLRLQMPYYILMQGGFNLQPKPEFEDVPETNVIAVKKAKVTSNWKSFAETYSSKNKTEITEHLIDVLVQSESKRINRTELERFAEATSADKEEYIIKSASYIMSLPEFQLI
ncbi:MAG: DUF1800 domain-containing protein [Bacteroidetes bacterium]|nr:DUF1800 domain-containing protein [Bacteroidota bacterium]MBP7398728.1 DUF1800 domain-containing protein [Chitinophagales bacterium]MBK8488617.1 DUF1800 domain-containing protein [Bacteroidota bacterium]MBP8752707.1 DUF1800 domain-containing protein [Chitinophagales bacterium]MBP9189446.1 DUF1800 domain-containing protein [Chitinophagales bacterium]